MDAKDCIPGRYVSYEPSPGRWFVGMVAMPPWQLGDGTWVTRLSDMEWQYAEFTGKKGEKRFTVFAACLDSCRIEEQPILIRYRPNSRADQNEYARRYRNDPGFKYHVDSMVANAIDGKASTDCYRLAVECAAQRLSDYFLERSTLSISR